MVVVVAAADGLAIEGEDDEACSDLVLIYNTVRGYCTAIKELSAKLDCNLDILLLHTQLSLER